MILYNAIQYKKIRKEQGAYSMCDVEKYNQIFNDIKQLQPNDTLQLILEAKTKEERDFYEMIGNYLLQNRQRKVVERNMF